MEIKYHKTGKERKDLVNAIAEITGAKALYKGVPTCNYEVDYYTIDKEGTLTFDDAADSSEVEYLLEQLLERGFEAEVAAGYEKLPKEETPKEPYELNIQMPASYFTEETFSNLERIIQAKGDLLKKALGVNKLPVIREEERVSFPWFTAMEDDMDAFKAYSHLVNSICEMAKNQKRVSVKEKPVENEKYAFRCFLLRLGFIGDEFKNERKILLKNLDGSAAFKGGVR